MTYRRHHDKIAGTAAWWKKYQVNDMTQVVVSRRPGSALASLGGTQSFMKSPKTSPTPTAPKPLTVFLAKFDPKVAKLIRACRVELRKLLPGAIELVYDNYNFFVIGYGPTERASDAIVSIAAAAHGVGLSFLQGASLPDPHKLLLGNGKQNRFIRLPTSQTIKSPEVVSLIHAAVRQAKTPIPNTGGGYMVIKSISKKQRPRRKDAT